MGQISLSDWIGRERVVQTALDSRTAAMMSATLEPQTVSRARGDPLPPLWHWSAFPVLEPMTALTEDGHPARGGFLPPVDLPRRMWAAGSLAFLRPLHVGETLTCHSTIREVTEKTGGTGRMVFVTVGHTVSGENGPAIEERQDIVYLPMPDRFVPPRPKPVPGTPLLDETVLCDQARLFRYSACTFNAHRIHYDLPYAQEVEKYPALVVHGPLQATLLMAMACRWKGRAPDRFEFRGVSPMFHDRPVRLLAEAAEGGLALATARGDERLGMQARATWDEEDTVWQGS